MLAIFKVSNNYLPTEMLFLSVKIDKYLWKLHAFYIEIAIISFFVLAELSGL